MFVNHRYDPTKKSKFKFPFTGLERIATNYSHVYQDLMALAVNEGKTNGYFLEVGGFDAINDSNTYILESLFGWKGISIDINDLTQNFSIRPNTKFVCANAVTLDYRQLLIDNNAPKQIEYLSLDIEPPIQTLNALKGLPLDEYRFNFVTFETDYYNQYGGPIEEREYVRSESRNILESNGYIKIFGNVSYLNNHTPFEDWYIDGNAFSPEYIKKFVREDDTALAVEFYLFG